MYKYHKDNVPNPKESWRHPENKEWYTQRNKQLLADSKVKTYRELSPLYGLSIPRLLTLITRERNKFMGN